MPSATPEICFLLFFKLFKLYASCKIPLVLGFGLGFFYFEGVSENVIQNQKIQTFCYKKHQKKISDAVQNFE